MSKYHDINQAVSATKQALESLRSIQAGTMPVQIDEDLLTAEQAVRRALNKIQKEPLFMALTWYHKHRGHVIALVKDCKHVTEPTGQDLYDPALWRDAHWNWFLE
jgi:esterase/lipase